MTVRVYIYIYISSKDLNTVIWVIDNSILLSDGAVMDNSILLTDGAVKSKSFSDINCIMMNS